MSNPLDDLDLQMDADTLYRESLVTDQKVGTLRVMTPITPDGETDSARPVLYQGQTQIMTQAGPLPVHFDIEAETLADAVAGYGEAARQGIEDTLQELERMRREAASSIVVPGQGGSPGGMGGGPAAGPGGSKIQMP